MLQYVDRNVGPADYNFLNSDELLVTNIWLSLQGEGPLAGTVAVFIRLAGCNKGDKEACEFCDTDFMFDEGRVFTVANLMQEVRLKYTPSFLFNDNPPLVIITGGEPMLQDNIVGLIECMPQYRIQIESNGDRLARGFIESEACRKAVLVISPKVNPRSKQYQHLSDVVFRRVDVLKFVVDAEKTSPYHDVPVYTYEWAMYKRSTAGIFVSPLTVYKRPVKQHEIASVWTDDLIDREATKRNYAYAASLCIKNGYRFSCQQHTLASVE